MADTRSRPRPNEDGSPARDHGVLEGAFAMATLPGAPHSHDADDDTDTSTLPVEPEFAPVIPDAPTEGERTPVPKPGE